MQSCLKNWNRIKQIEGHKKARLSKSRQFNTSYTAPLGGQERSYLTRIESLYLLSWVPSKGKEYMRSPAAPLF